LIASDPFPFPWPQQFSHSIKPQPATQLLAYDADRGFRRLLQGPLENIPFFAVRIGSAPQYVLKSLE
jgi:hypothetical protein